MNPPLISSDLPPVHDGNKNEFAESKCNADNGDSWRGGSSCKHLENIFTPPPHPPKTLADRVGYFTELTSQDCNATGSNLSCSQYCAVFPPPFHVKCFWPWDDAAVDGGREARRVAVKAERQVAHCFCRTLREGGKGSTTPAFTNSNNYIIIKLVPFRQMTNSSIAAKQSTFYPHNYV